MESHHDPSTTIPIDGDDDTKNFSWPPLESNPDVFTEYLHSIGLSPSFSIGDIYGFDEELLAFVPQPVLGVIVCYEYLIEKSQYRNQDRGTTEDYNKVAFYMHQSKALDNACGIIACLHSIFNSAAKDVDPSSVLGKFREKIMVSSPAERCAILENDSNFKKIHKKYSSMGQTQEITSDQSAVKNHFVAYVLNEEGQLVELDGTKIGPVVIGDCGGDLLRGSIREVKGKLERKEVSESLNMMILKLSQE